MLNEIFQSLWVWVWQLLRRGTPTSGTLRSRQSPAENEPISPVGAGLQKTHADPSEEDGGNAPISKVDLGSRSRQDLTDCRENNVRDDHSRNLKENENRQYKSQRQPGKIRGRRNGRMASRPSVGKAVMEDLKTSPRPELICRNARGSSQWEVVLSADNEIDVKEVRQGGKLLNLVNGECSLSSLAGYLSIIYGDRESDKLPLYNDTPLVFKMPNEWEGDGRRVSGVTIGHFIVLTPKDWNRKGNAPVEPEECTDVNFTAHFFHKKKGESAEAVGGFEGRQLELTASGFKLNGDIVVDSSIEGKLFVGAPPELKPSSGVTWARIGEEREGGWKGENFKPTERSLKDVLNGRQGRFFVRVYDHKGLRDSGQFRYLRGLREIRVDGQPYSPNTILLPSSAGYSTVEVHFVGTAAAPILPIIDRAGTHRSI